MTTKLELKNEKFRKIQKNIKKPRTIDLVI
jgi:hypothetical protein